MPVCHVTFPVSLSLGGAEVLTFSPLSCFSPLPAFPPLKAPVWTEGSPFLARCGPETSSPPVTLTALAALQRED